MLIGHFPAYSQSAGTDRFRLILSNDNAISPKAIVTIKAVGAVSTNRNLKVKWQVSPEDLILATYDPLDISGKTINLVGKSLPEGMQAPSFVTVMAEFGQKSSTIMIPYRAVPLSLANTIEFTSATDASVLSGRVAKVTVKVKDANGAELSGEKVEWKILGTDSDKYVRRGNASANGTEYSTELFGLLPDDKSTPGALILQASVGGLSNFVRIAYNEAASTTVGAAVAGAKSGKSVSAGDVQIIKSGIRTFLSDMLIKEIDAEGKQSDESAFIVLGPREMVEFRFPDARPCRLESTNNSNVAVADGQVLIGRRLDTEATIKLKCSDTRENLAAGTSVELAQLKEAKTFTVKVRNETENKITTDTTVVPYKTVKDSFGSRVADRFMVVQVNVSNKSAINQFYLQELQVMLDPKQCEKVQNYYNEIVSYTTAAATTKQRGRQKVELTDDKRKEYISKCQAYFDDYFVAPTPLEPIQNERILAVGEMHSNMNIRKLGFGLLKFVADFGGPLTGLKLLGRDGIKGFGFLGSSIYPSADTFAPNSAPRQFEALRASLPPAQIIVKSRDHALVNVFIPLDKIVQNGHWKMYKADTKNGSDDGHFMKVMLELFTVAAVNGVLITENAPKVDVKPGGGVNGLEIFSRP